MTHRAPTRLAIDPLLERLARACLAIAATALCLMAAVQAWQVFARYVLNDSPSWTEPTALLLMNAAMMFGAAAGVHGKAHFGFYILSDSASAGMRRVLLAFSHGCCAVIAALLAIWAARLVVDGWDVRIAGAPLPQGLNYLPLALGGSLITAFALRHLVADSRAQNTDT